MAKPQFTYFNYKGLGEAIRLTLVVGKIEFEDKRISHPGAQEWQEMKPSAPLGKLPLYVEGDVTLSESHAILRHVGRKTGLYPEDSVKAAQCDQIIDAIKDMVYELSDTLKSKIHETIEVTAEARTAMRKVMATSTLPRYLAALEKLVQGDYFLGDKMSIADLSVAPTLSWFTSGILDGIPTTLVDDYPKLKALVDKVHAHEDIAAWYAK